MIIFLPLMITFLLASQPDTPAWAPCPKSPNCVNTLDPKPRKRMSPLVFAGTADSAKVILKQLISDFPRTRLLRKEGEYLHYEFTTAIGRFSDDVEFLIDKHSQCIHFRSASRVGYSDLGANRRRMKKITKQWQKRNALDY